jgi:hypothetical protein
MFISDNSSQSGATPGTPRTDFPPGFQGEGWSQQSPAPGQTGSNFSPGGMNFPMATPFSQQFGFSMPPQMFPYMQNSWNNYMFNQVGPGQTFTPPTSMPSGQETSSPAQNATPTLTSEGSPPKPDLPPLPPSPKTPPPPGTEGEEMQMFPPSSKPEEKKILEEIPLPPPTKKSEDDEEVIEDTTEIPSLDEIPLPPVCGDGDDLLLDQGTLCIPNFVGLIQSPFAELSFVSLSYTSAMGYFQDF